MACCANAAILDVMYAQESSGLDVLRYVGFRTQNNVMSWQNFDDEYLNNYNWPETLRRAQILPVLGQDEKISANHRKCILVPEFITRLQKTDDVTGYFYGSIIDMAGKNQYAPLLEAIGCEKVSGEEIFRFLKENTEDFISNKEFRDGVYAYLSNNQGNTVFEISSQAALSLPVFPVKMEGTTKYIKYCSNIYTHKNEVSRDDYFILNTSVMSLELADRILNGRGRINELTQEVFDAKYQKTLRDYIENTNGRYSMQQVALYVLDQFRNNRAAFEKCKPTLMGLMPLIPFKMENGEYKKGKKFLNSRNQWYAGSLIQSMVVGERF